MGVVLELLKHLIPDKEGDLGQSEDLLSVESVVADSVGNSNSGAAKLGLCGSDDCGPGQSRLQGCMKAPALRNNGLAQQSVLGLVNSPKSLRGCDPSEAMEREGHIGGSHNQLVVNSSQILVTISW